MAYFVVGVVFYLLLVQSQCKPLSCNQQQKHRLLFSYYSGYYSQTTLQLPDSSKLDIKFLQKYIFLDVCAEIFQQIRFIITRIHGQKKNKRSIPLGSFICLWISLVWLSRLVLLFVRNPSSFLLQYSVVIQSSSWSSAALTSVRPTHFHNSQRLRSKIAIIYAIFRGIFLGEISYVEIKIKSESKIDNWRHKRTGARKISNALG